MEVGRLKVALAHLIDIWVLFLLPLHSQALIELVGLQQIGCRGRETINHENRRSSSLCAGLDKCFHMDNIYMCVCVCRGVMSCHQLWNY